MSGGENIVQFSFKLQSKTHIYTHTQKKKIFSLCVHVFLGPHSNMDAPEDWHVPPRVRH